MRCNLTSIVEICAIQPLLGKVLASLKTFLTIGEIGFYPYTRLEVEVASSLDLQTIGVGVVPHLFARAAGVVARAMVEVTLAVMVLVTRVVFSSLDEERTCSRG